MSSLVSMKLLYTEIFYFILKALVQSDADSADRADLARRLKIQASDIQEIPLLFTNALKVLEEVDLLELTGDTVRLRHEIAYYRDVAPSTTYQILISGSNSFDQLIGQALTNSLRRLAPDVIAKELSRVIPSPSTTQTHVTDSIIQVNSDSLNAEIPLRDSVEATENSSGADQPTTGIEQELSYVTTRAADPEKPGSFSNDGIPTYPTYGEARVSFPDRKAGEIPSPWWFETANPKKHVMVVSLVNITKMKFVSSTSSVDEITIFVHGACTDFESALKRAAQLAFDTSYRGRMIAYSWPSRGRKGVLSYNADLAVVDRASDGLVDLIESLQAVDASRPIHVIAYSLGAHITMKAIERLGASKVSEAIFVAPDVTMINYAWLAPFLAIGTKRTTIYTNTKDKVLLLSGKYRKTTRILGLQNLDAAMPGIEVIDASRIKGRSLLGGHSYLYNPTISQDMSQVLLGIEQLRALLIRLGAPTGSLLYRFKHS